MCHEEENAETNRKCAPDLVFLAVSGVGDEMSDLGAEVLPCDGQHLPASLQEHRERTRSAPDQHVHPVATSLGHFVTYPVVLMCFCQGYKKYTVSGF